jgi:phosphoribosylformylglycinamidine synthase
MKARVLVTPRKEVLDPQGVAVQHAIGQLGLEGVGGVRVGRVVEIEFPSLSGEPSAELVKTVEGICEDLLSNPVVEDYDLTWIP